MARRIDAALDRAGLSPLTRPAWVEVDIDVLSGNAGVLATLASPAELGVVVKADGYGHGLEISARCAVAGGATWLCVADAGEAIRLRDDGYRGRIFVLYPVPAPVVPQMADLDIDLTVGTLDQARRLADEVSSVGVRAHLEVDTGMTRGGVSPDEVVEAAAILGDGTATSLVGVWTHLAAPEDPASTEAQLALFEESLMELGEAGVRIEETHVSASGGLLAIRGRGHTLTRIGLAFYGHDPGVGRDLPNGARPALAVRAHPVRIATIPAGTSVGYAGTWTAPRVSRVATLPLGYADGWARSSSPGGEVLVEGERVPVVGRISSDSLTVDVTGVPEAGYDSEFTLLGAAGDDLIGVDEIADTRATISWEVLQQLGSRLSRVYMSNGAVVASRAESVTAIDVTGPMPGYHPVVGDRSET